MNEKIQQKWEKILSNRKVFIFGAGYSAGYLYDLIDYIGRDVDIIAFVVSDINKNVREYKGRPVIQIDQVEDKTSLVLVPNTGTRVFEIEDVLKKNTFANYVLVSRLIMESQFENNPFIIEEQKRYLDIKNSDDPNDTKLRAYICECLADGQPRFGDLEPYQSLERIGLVGKRPTSYRIEKYGLKKILNKQMNVLDIGCNTSFIDLAIAPKVKNVLGIEHEAIYVGIAKKVRNYLGIDNVEIWQGEFIDWLGENQNKYDLILSFAVHRWMGLKPSKYMETMSELLNPGGFICIESHVDVDCEYEECIESGVGIGLQIEREGTICDSRDGERRYAIIRKL